MPIRWVICPMVFIEGPDVGTIDEEGHEVAKKVNRFEALARSLVVGRVQVVEHFRVSNQAVMDRWCLCQVKADDFSKVDAEPRCIYVFDDDEPDFDESFGERRLKTFRQLGWTQGRLNRAKSFLESNGITLADLNIDLDSPRRDIIRAIKRAIKAGAAP